MKIHRHLLLASILLCCALPAQAAGFLWKVEGGAAPLYLLGSLHVLPPRAYPLPAKFDRAYQDVRVLVFETDMAAIDTPELQRKFVNAGVYPEGESMQSRWSQPLLKRFNKAVKELKLPVEMFNRTRPWLAALTLELTTYKQAGFDTEKGVDHFLFKRARADRKTIVTLESPSAQMRLFTDMPDAMAESFLDAAITNLDELDFDPDSLYELWEDEDSDELDDMLENMREDHADIYARFVAQRNRAWMLTIAELVRDGKPAMVVAGALHMPGPDGLVQLLENAGYAVKAVER